MQVDQENLDHGKLLKEGWERVVGSIPAKHIPRLKEDIDRIKAHFDAMFNALQRGATASKSKAS